MTYINGIEGVYLRIDYHFIKFFSFNKKIFFFFQENENENYFSEFRKNGVTERQEKGGILKFWKYISLCRDTGITK